MSENTLHAMHMMLAEHWPEESLLLGMKVSRQVRNMIVFSKRRVLLEQSIGYVDKRRTSFMPVLQRYRDQVATSLAQFSEKQVPIKLRWSSGGGTKAANATTLLSAVLTEAVLQLERKMQGVKGILTIDTLIFSDPVCPRDEANGTELLMKLSDYTQIRHLEFDFITPWQLTSTRSGQLLQRLSLNQLTLRGELNGMQTNQLAEAFKGMQVIDLQNVSHEYGAMCAVMNGLASDSLRVLRVTGDDVPMDAMSTPVNHYYDFMATMRCPHLAVLDLSGNTLGFDFVESIANSKALPVTLQQLVLADNLFSDKALVLLAPCFERLSCLQRLDLSNNYPEQGATLCVLLAVLRTLPEMHELLLGSWKYEVLACASNRIGRMVGGHFWVRPAYVLLPTGATVDGFDLADELADPVQQEVALAVQQEQNTDGMRVYVTSKVASILPAIGSARIVHGSDCRRYLRAVPPLVHLAPQQYSSSSEASSEDGVA